MDIHKTEANPATLTDPTVANVVIDGTTYKLLLGA